MLEASIAAVGIIFILIWNTSENNTVISKTCGKVASIAPNNALFADRVYTMKNPRKGELNLNLIISTVIA